MDIDLSMKLWTGRICNNFRNTVISGEKRRNGHGIREGSKEH